MLAAILCSRHSGHGPFPKYVVLELRDSTEYSVQHSTRRRARVDMVR